MTNHLVNLLELNLSKNNKKPATPPTTTIQNLPITTINTTTSISSRLSFSTTESLLNNLTTNNKLSHLSNPHNLQHNSSSLSFFSNMSMNSQKCFNSLINLRKLDLSENNLHNIPPDIKDLRFLEELTLNKNNLEFIANELTELRSLKSLSLVGNRIGELSDAFCAYAQFGKTLLKLNLRCNKLRTETFSAKIGLFENLEELDLAENEFDVLPNTLPKSLSQLNFAKNRLRTLMVRPLASSVRNDDELMKALRLDKAAKLLANVYIYRKYRY